MSTWNEGRKTHNTAFCLSNHEICVCACWGGTPFSNTHNYDKPSSLLEKYKLPNDHSGLEHKVLNTVGFWQTRNWIRKAWF